MLFKSSLLTLLPGIVHSTPQFSRRLGLGHHWNATVIGGSDTGTPSPTGTADFIYQQSYTSAYPMGADPSYTPPAAATMLPKGDEPGNVFFYQNPGCQGGCNGDEVPVPFTSYTGFGAAGLACAEKMVGPDNEGAQLNLNGAGYIVIEKQLSNNCQFHFYSDESCATASWLGFFTAPMQQPLCMNLTSPEGDSLVSQVNSFSYVYDDY
ncbi:hypothetical protein G7Y89_g1172 [Cudoniella acicularis]|uniref:Uncharacterized protein n=1 Tax=Cudoniella acicularis TaxID=354080 RepID=A0A8H4W7N4_9HELO|nr:hypothetical protein G7Y89_g1172 [Cudoniella acicularis]